MKAWSHQKRCLEFIKNKNRSGLFLTMGGGKSKIALDYLAYLYKENKIDLAIIFAPKSIVLQWEVSQIPLHYSEEYLLFKYNNLKTSGKAYMESFNEFILNKSSNRLKIFLTNSEILSKGIKFKYYLEKLFKYHFNIAIILDEISTCKNKDSIITKQMFNISKNEKVKYFTGLTGTELTESPLELYSIMNVIQPNFFNISFFSFKSNYSILIKKVNYNIGKTFTSPLSIKDKEFLMWYLKKYLNKEKIKTNFGVVDLTLSEIARKMEINVGDVNLIYQNWKKQNFDPNYLPKNYKNIDKLLQKISSICISISPKELEIPFILEDKIYLECPPEIKKLSSQLKKDMLTNFDSKELELKTKLSLALRLQQLSGGHFPYIENNKTEYTKIIPNLKIEYLIEELSLLPKNDSIIIWSRFVKELELLYDTFSEIYDKDNISIYGGNLKQEEKKENLINFINGKTKILIANPQSAAMGLNLQIANRNYFYSLSFSLAQYEQLIKRTARPGQTKTVFFKALIYKNTIDQIIYDALANKKELYDYVKFSSFLHNL